MGSDGASGLEMWTEKICQSKDVVKPDGSKRGIVGEAFQAQNVNNLPAEKCRNEITGTCFGEPFRPIQNPVPLRRSNSRAMDVRYDTMNGVLGSSPQVPLGQTPTTISQVALDLNPSNIIQIPVNMNGIENCQHSQNANYWTTSGIDNRSRRDTSKDNPSTCSCSCRKRKACRHFCACLKRIPRRFIRLIQWCYVGDYRQRTVCWGCCDLYSMLIAIIVCMIIVGDHIHTRTHCIGVQYTSDYLCSERYMSFPCNYPNREFLEDEELLNRCGIQGDSPPINFHDNSSIETTCGSIKPSKLSQKIRKYGANRDEGMQYKVPNIVHYTIDCHESARFDYINYLSFVSVQKFLAPDKIYVHTNCVLNSTWWQRTVTDVMNVYAVSREFPEYIQTRPARRTRDRSDVIKLQTLYRK